MEQFDVEQSAIKFIAKMNELTVSRILKITPRHPLVNLYYVSLTIQTRCVSGKNQELNTEEHLQL